MNISTLILTTLVLMIVVFIPAVNAESSFVIATGPHDEKVGAGVQGDKNGSYYYNCSWHSAVWNMSGGVSFYSLSWTFRANGAVLETGITFADTSHDRTASGPYSSMGASATGAFRYNGGSVYYISTSQAYIS